MKTEVEQIANRASQLSAAMSHGQACYTACLEMGVEKSAAPATASIVSTILTNREISFSGPARIATEREALKLRSRDRIEGGDVVLSFKRGRELRLSKSEWVKLVSTKHEPHAIAALRLK